MTRLFKSAPQFTKEINGRQVTGIFSVFGVKDGDGDVVHTGSFTKTFQERGNKIFHLWQHDFKSPPIAAIDLLSEIGRDELTDEILAKHPEATGGAQVTRTYLETVRGDEVLAAIVAKSPLQMSYGYDVIRHDMETGTQTRHLRELKLYETSDVLWGANGATTASKAAALSIPLDLITQQLLAHLEEMKVGSRNNTADMARINQIAQLAIELGATNVNYIEEDGEATPETDVEEAKEQRRVGAKRTPPLTLLKARLSTLDFDLDEVLRNVS